MAPEFSRRVALAQLGAEPFRQRIEATAEETESRLLKGLCQRCPDLPADIGLSETLAALRRGQGIGPGSGHQRTRVTRGTGSGCSRSDNPTPLAIGAD